MGFHDITIIPVEAIMGLVDAGPGSRVIWNRVVDDQVPLDLVSHFVKVNDTIMAIIGG